MNSNGVGRDVYTRERLFVLIEEFFGIRQAIEVDGWAELAGYDEEYETDEFTVLKWEVCFE